jgi:hypothetical protein
MYEVHPHQLEEGQIVGHLTRLSHGEHYLLIGELERLGYTDDVAMSIKWPKSCYVIPLKHASQDAYSRIEFNFSPTEIDCIFTPYKESVT